MADDKGFTVSPRYSSRKPPTRSAQWGTVLTADEIRLLADGVHPRLIRPECLVSYWPPEPTLEPKES